MSDSLIIVISFITAIVVARIAVKVVWSLNLHALKKRSIAGVPVHHFSYGLLLMAVSGYIAVITSVEHWIVACLFGVGLGLIVDELYPAHVTLGKFWEKADTKGSLYWGKTAYVILALASALLVVLAFA